MADNYLENQYAQYEARKAAWEKERKLGVIKKQSAPSKQSNSKSEEKPLTQALSERTMHIQQIGQDPKYFSELLQLWEMSIRSTHQFLLERDIEFYRVLVLHYLPTVELYIIRNKQEKVIAFMGLSDELIEMLFVHPDEQGKGVGKQLICFAIHEKQIQKIDVNEQNTAALHCYQHLGFQVIGRDEVDYSGKPYPVLHLQRKSHSH